MERFKFYLRAVLYKEDNDFVAHCLEMDLLGYGKTQKKAIEELISVIKTQIEYALENNNPSLIYFPAPSKYFEMYEKAKASCMKSLIDSKKETKESKYNFKDISFKDIHIPAGVLKKFSEVQSAHA